MNNKNYINFHVLISHSPSCLNRDDMNMQKTAVFGGVPRVRISSQSLKRAMRKSEYYTANLGEPSVRSRSLQKLNELFLKELEGEFDPAIIAETIDRFAKTGRSENGDGDNEDEGSESSGAEEAGGDKKSIKKLAVAPWVLNEIRALCGIIASVKREGLTEAEQKTAQDKFAKQKAKKKTLDDFLNEMFDKKIGKAIKANADSVEHAYAKAVDIALSGRMATSGLMTSIDGSLAVAHAITTHAVDKDIDWFTAVDDMVADAGEVGAGHLDTQEFSSGVFYRYASLNIGQLQRNLGGASRERALEIAKYVLHMLATVVPTAKQQSFAAHNLADLAIVSFADQPISLANAFEAPVERERKNGSGFLAPSINKLATYWDRINKGYGLSEIAAAFNLDGRVLPDGLTSKRTLPELEAWVAAGGE